MGACSGIVIRRWTSIMRCYTSIMSNRSSLLIKFVTAYGIHRNVSWPPMIHRGIGAFVAPRRLLMGNLGCCRLNVVFSDGHPLFGCRHCGNPAWAIKAGVIINCGVINNCIIYIGIMNDGSIDVHYRCVITKGSSLPHATSKTNTTISKAVIHAAIKAYMSTPITAMPPVISSGIAPITRCP